MGLLMLAGGGALVFCGYFGERAVRGLQLTASIAWALAYSIVRAVLCLALWLFLWAVAITALVLNAIVNFGAAPAVLVSRLIQGRGAQAGAGLEPAATGPRPIRAVS